MDDLLENRPLPAIRAFFADKGIPMVVHQNPPRPPGASERRRLPRLVRRSMTRDASTHWVDLGTAFPFYGSGTSEEGAIRRAAQRYRVEQGDPAAS